MDALHLRTVKTIFMVPGHSTGTQDCSQLPKRRGSWSEGHPDQASPEQSGQPRAARALQGVHTGQSRPPHPPALSR